MKFTKKITSKLFIGTTTLLLILMIFGIVEGSEQRSDVIIYDPLDGSTVGTLVGNPQPVLAPGVFDQGAQPLRGSFGAAIQYHVQPPASGTILFWVKVVAPIEFYRGGNIGFYGREVGGCNDFFMQLQNNGGLNVAIFSGAGGTFFRDVFPEPLSWNVGEVHHLAVTWGSGVRPQFYIDGVQFTLRGAALPYVKNCGSSTTPLLFVASRELYQQTYSPGPFVFDDFSLLNRPLSAVEVSEIVNMGKPLFIARISIDIKPGKLPNSINPRNKGKIAVAILTTEELDAATVDAKTVLFGANGNEAYPVQSAIEDVDGDGKRDMMLHFNTQDTGIVCGDSKAYLTGETFNGQAIEGYDSIVTVGCK